MTLIHDHNPNEVFYNKLRDYFKDSGFPKKTVDYILEQITPIKVVGHKIISNCKDNFYKEQIIEEKIHDINKIVKDFWGKNYTFVLDNNDDSQMKAKKSQKPVKAKSQDHSIFAYAENNDKTHESQITIEIEKDTKSTSQKTDKKEKRDLISDFTFSNFVKGESNIVAYSACEAVSKNPGNLSNPLFIYGETGLGKTHLLHAVGHEIQKNNPKARVHYLTSADFVNEVIQGIRFGKMEDIRKRYRSCDVLLVDDIQFLENKDTCQLEFFHIFNELYLSRKQIVITSDKTPKDIPNIEERLKSRFMQGLLADIESPSFEDRVAIIESKIKKFELKLTRDIVYLISTHVKTNVREIEGILKTLLMSQHMTGKSPTVNSTIELLKRVSKYEIENLDFNAIQKAVAQFFNLKTVDLTGKSRAKNIVYARHIAMFLTKEFLHSSIVSIAKHFGKRDHTTVMHALSKIKKSIKEDDKTQQDYLKIKKKLNNIIN